MMDDGAPVESRSTEHVTPGQKKKRVAVLGGGAGALTTAYYLSRTQELRDTYEVPVYQLGWRLAG